MLTKVLYIAEAAVSKISSIQLDQAGVSSLFLNGECEMVYKSDNDMFTDDGKFNEEAAVFAIQGGYFHFAEHQTCVSRAFKLR